MTLTPCLPPVIVPPDQVNAPRLMVKDAFASSVPVVIVPPFTVRALFSVIVLPYPPLILSETTFRSGRSLIAGMSPPLEKSKVIFVSRWLPSMKGNCKVAGFTGTLIKRFPWSVAQFRGSDQLFVGLIAPSGGPSHW